MTCISVVFSCPAFFSLFCCLHASCTLERRFTDEEVPTGDGLDDMVVTEGCRGRRSYNYRCEDANVVTKTRCYKQNYYITDLGSSDLFQPTKSNAGSVDIETSPVRKEDAAVYCCELKEEKVGELKEGKVDENCFHLLVQEIPHPVLSREEICAIEQSGSTNSTLCKDILHCTIPCNNSQSTADCGFTAEPVVSFEHDGQIISPESSVITNKTKSWQLQLQPEDEGRTFRCTLGMPQYSSCDTNGTQSNSIQIPEKEIGSTSFPKEKDEKKIIEILAGVPVVVALFLLVIIVVCVCIWKKKRIMPIQRDDPYIMPIQDDPRKAFGLRDSTDNVVEFESSV